MSSPLRATFTEEHAVRGEAVAIGLALGFVLAMALLLILLARG